MQFRDSRVASWKASFRSRSRPCPINVDEVLELLPTFVLINLEVEDLDRAEYFYRQLHQILSPKPFRQIYYCSLQLTTEDISQLSDSEIVNLLCSKPINKKVAYKSIETFDIYEMQTLIYQDDDTAKFIIYDPK